jgi:putative flippase GtrA
VSRMDKILRHISVGLVVVAVLSSIALLASDANILDGLGQWTARISAAPLLAVGLAFLIFQPTLRPRWAELLKNLLLAATFLLWGAVELMPPTIVSRRLGNLVIALYVIELGWTILARLKVTRRSVE